MTSPADYMNYLIDVACESMRDPISPVPNLSAPATFIAETLRAMALPSQPITRMGTNRAADILFTHPDVTTLFRNMEATSTLYAIINGEVLPAGTAVFRDHWNYIIGPAMDEHVGISRLLSPR
jgi:hypothetical protein